MTRDLPTLGAMAGRFDDDDDWVGTPPEGRYTRDRADPGFWASHRPISFVGFGIVVVLVVLLVVVLL